MMVKNDPKIVLVTRRTRLDELVTRFNTVAQARFYVEHLGADFEDYLKEHLTYYGALRSALADLERRARVQVLDRGFLSNFLFDGVDLVVALGQDGLVANTLKYLKALPLMGVNPDPARWSGVLLPFTVQNLAGRVSETLGGKRKLAPVTMARARLADGQEMLAVNELFIGRKTHVSATYELAQGKHCEPQSSSGVLVATGLGGSGWMRSLQRGAEGILGHTRRAPETKSKARRKVWQENALTFAVREPFPGNGLSTDLIYGRVTGDNPLKIVSTMPEDGVIFSDGMERDFLSFNSGFQVTIEPAPQKGMLVV